MSPYAIMALGLGSFLPIREAAMVSQFAPYMPMDYQRTFSADGSINRGYVNAGNYNYGLVAANAGYSLPQTLFAAGAANVANPFGTGSKAGPYFTNPNNNPEIVTGYQSASKPW